MGLAAVAAGQPEGCSMLAALKQSSLWDFVTGAQNKITVEDSVPENVGGAYDSMNNLLYIPGRSCEN